jgi:hypothetical protein
MSTLLLTGVWTTLIRASPDGSLTARFEDTGQYDIVTAGVGLYGTTTGDINLNVPVTGTVKRAFLYWAGYTNTPGGDDQIDFTVDSTTTSITADYVMSDPWSVNGDHYVYIEDLAISLINTGPETYTVSGVEIAATQDEHNYGAGLMVVYEDPSLPYSTVKIYDGLDGFYFLKSGQENSEVTPIDFAPASTDRTMDIKMFVGGVENDWRANAIWYETGTGAQPTDIVGTSNLLGGSGYNTHPYPLGASDGEEWDTFTGSITVPTDDTWTCIQIESIPNEFVPGWGCSALLISIGVVLPTEEAPGTGTPGYWKNHPDAWPVDTITIGGVLYTKAEAIEIMETAGKGDKTYTMFNQLVAAKLNVLIGNPSSCIAATISDADDWMTANPLGSGVKANAAVWKNPGQGEDLKDMLDDYNNGLLCAPPRD